MGDGTSPPRWEMGGGETSSHGEERVSACPKCVLSMLQNTSSRLLVPDARPLPTIAAAQSRLAKSLAELNVTKSEQEQSLEISVRELTALEEQEQDLRKEVERVEGKREWDEEFRGWIEMLGRFLEEKVTCLCSSIHR